MNKFGFEVFTRFFLFLVVDCVAGKVAGLCNGEKSRTEENRVPRFLFLFCLVYKVYL